MNPNVRRLALLSTLALAAPLAFGQAPPPETTGLEIKDPAGDVVITIAGEGRPRIALAYPRTREAPGETAAASAASHELDQTLRADLDATRAFDVQGPEALAVLTLSGEPGQDLEQYRSLGNEILLLVATSEQGDKLVVEGRLLDLKNGESILGKRYEGTFDLARRIAHTLADEIVHYLLGRRGIARTSIAFTSDRSGYKELYLMDYDGAGQRRVTAHKSITMGSSWSPDGSSLLYLSYLNGPPAIFRVDLSSGRKQTIIGDDRHNFGPAFAPDGKHLLFARSIDGNSEIFAAAIDGSGARQLTHHRAIDTNAVWSPNGQAIAFTTSRAGSPQIFLMDADGANVRRLSFDGEYNDGAAWNPEGTRVAYASRRDGIFQIAVTEVVTLETKVLTAGNLNKEEPTFSPDGQRIVFTAKGRTGSQLYVMDLEGNVLAQLTTEGNNTSAAWSPYPAQGR